jgi:hypothetical protein
MSESNSRLTVSVGSRINPDHIAPLQHYAAAQGLTVSKFIAKLVATEIRRLNSAQTEVADA